MPQLNLFKGKRQRGEQPPAPKEFATHCALAELLRRWCNPDWRWTHIPLGEHRDIVTAARLKRMGVNPGWPDFIFVGPGAHVLFIELKRAGGPLSASQCDIGMHLIRCGVSYLCTSSLEDAIGTLRDLGVLRATVAV